MRQFFEKRWWGGVGVIIALILGLPALLQYFGKVDIPWLAVTIALNIILVVTLVLVAIWITKLKRKYEDASSRLKKQEQPRKRQRVLLPDLNYICRLNIDNVLLTELYSQAHGLATTRFHDSKLNSLHIIVRPYHEDRVSIIFGFYSQWGNRKCTCIVSEIRDITESLPSKPAEFEATFDELPWLRDPDWLEFLKKSCEKVGPLSQADWTMYHLSTYAWASQEKLWHVSFEDGGTGKEFGFSWDGKGEPIPED